MRIPYIIFTFLTVCSLLSADTNTDIKKDTNIKLESPATKLSPDLQLIDEANFFKDDGRKWKSGQEFETDQMKTVIYILDSETMNNASESLAAQLSTVPTQPLEKVDEWLPPAMYQNIGESLQYRIVSKDPQGFFLEWWLPKSENQPPKHGWIKALKTDKGLYMLEYTTTKEDQVEKLRKIWQPKLQNAKAPI